MLQKNPKIVNPAVREVYKEAFPYCEACAKLDGLYPVTNSLELHHILPGNDRTDEIWNFIHLCNKHHRLSTHHAVGGENHGIWNSKYWAIKYLKAEITMDQIKQIQTIEIILVFIDEIRNSFKYRVGKGFGWYKN